MSNNEYQHETKKPTLQTRISMNQNRESYQGRSNRFLLSRLSNQMPSLESRMSILLSSLDTRQGDLGSKPWSANFKMKSNPEKIHSQKSTESSTGDHIYQRKRKRQPSDSVLKRSTRQRREPDVDSQHLDQPSPNRSIPLEQRIQASLEASPNRPTLLSRLGSTAKFSSTPTMGQNMSQMPENRRNDFNSRNLRCPGMDVMTLTS